MGAADRGGTRGMAPTTLAYTSFLTATAYRGDVLDVMTVILPCAVSYREIALTMKDQIAPDSLYTDWMEFFVGDFYGGRLDGMQANLDELADRAGSIRRDALRLAFCTASRLEVGFWDLVSHWRLLPELAVEAGCV